MDMCFDGLFKNHHTVLFGRLINYYVEINWTHCLHFAHTPFHCSFKRTFRRWTTQISNQIQAWSRYICHRKYVYAHILILLLWTSSL